MTTSQIVYLSKWRKAVGNDKEYKDGFGFDPPLVSFPKDADPSWCVETCKKMSNEEFTCYGATPMKLIQGMESILDEHPIGFDGVKMQMKYKFDYPKKQ